jgi:hypothetical protein
VDTRSFEVSNEVWEFLFREMHEWPHSLPLIFDFAASRLDDRRLENYGFSFLPLVAIALSLARAIPLRTFLAAVRLLGRFISRGYSAIADHVEDIFVAVREACGPAWAALYHCLSGARGADLLALAELCVAGLRMPFRARNFTAILRHIFPRIPTVNVRQVLAAAAPIVRGRAAEDIAAMRGQKWTESDAVGRSPLGPVGLRGEAVICSVVQALIALPPFAAAALGDQLLAPIVAEMLFADVEVVELPIKALGEEPTKVFTMLIDRAGSNLRDLFAVVEVCEGASVRDSLRKAALAVAPPVLVWNILPRKPEYTPFPERIEAVRNSYGLRSIVCRHLERFWTLICGERIVKVEQQTVSEAHAITGAFGRDMHCDDSGEATLVFFLRDNVDHEVDGLELLDQLPPEFTAKIPYIAAEPAEAPHTALKMRFFLKVLAVKRPSEEFSRCSAELMREAGNEAAKVADELYEELGEIYRTAEEEIVRGVSAVVETAVRRAEDDIAVKIALHAIRVLEQTARILTAEPILRIVAAINSQKAIEHIVKLGGNRTLLSFAVQCAQNEQVEDKSWDCGFLFVVLDMFFCVNANKDEYKELEEYLPSYANNPPWSLKTVWKKAPKIFGESLVFGNPGMSIT